jgi:hypothetical protein
MQVKYWRRKWQPTVVFLVGKSHAQRRLAGYSPWGQKESDTTERLTNDKQDLSGDGVGMPLKSQHAHHQIFFTIFTL